MEKLYKGEQIYIEESTELTKEIEDYLKIRYANKHDDQIDAVSFALTGLLKKVTWWQRLLNWFRRRFNVRN